jgi:hypothetical protein
VSIAVDGGKKLVCMSEGLVKARVQTSPSSTRSAAPGEFLATSFFLTFQNKIRCGNPTKRDWLFAGACPEMAIYLANEGAVQKEKNITV